MVSIIILAYKNNDLTLQCIDSILNNTEVEHEIIIIDNNSQLNLDKNRYNGVKLIHNSQNVGFSRGSNQGAKEGGGDLLLFLNNDTIVTGGWLKAMVEVMNSSQDIGIVGSKLLFPGTSQIQHAGIIFLNRHPGHIYYKMDGNGLPVNNIKEYPAVTGACLLIRKELFFRVGGFDEDYINSYEDVDLCLKVRREGFRVMYTPKSVVYHYGSKAPGRHDYDQRNLNLLLNKWKDSVLLK